MKTPAEYVNPYIGTLGHLLTSTRPVTALPHSYAKIFPTVTGSKYKDYYISENIRSFPVGPVELTFAPEGAVDAESAVSRYDVGGVDSHHFGGFSHAHEIVVGRGATLRVGNLRLDDFVASGSAVRVRSASVGFVARANGPCRER